MRIKWRFWIEKKDKPIMGKGGYEILKAVKEYGSILKASKMLGMSYRFVWDYLRRMEDALEDRVVLSERGGIEGGKTVLTPLGEKLLKTYEVFESFVESALNGKRGVVRKVEGKRVLIEIVDHDLNVGDVVVLIRNGDKLYDELLKDVEVETDWEES